MDDHAPPSRLQARHLTHRTGILATRHEKSAGLDQATVPSLIQGGPKAATAIVVIKVSANVDAVQNLHLLRQPLPCTPVSL